MYWAEQDALTKYVRFHRGPFSRFNFSVTGLVAFAVIALSVTIMLPSDMTTTTPRNYQGRMALPAGLSRLHFQKASFIMTLQ